MLESIERAIEAKNFKDAGQELLELDGVEFHQQLEEMTDRLSVDDLLALSEGGQESWPLARLKIAQRFFETGRSKAALDLFKGALDICDPRYAEPHEVTHAIKLALELKMAKSAIPLLGVLTERVLSGEMEAKDNLTTSLRDFDRFGHSKIAETFWQVLLKDSSIGDSFIKPYERFLSLKEPLSEVEPKNGYSERMLQARELIAEGELDGEKIIELCRDDLEEYADSDSVDVWISIAHKTAQEFQQTRLANRVWKVLLDTNPWNVPSFMNFSARFNEMGSYPEVDDLIRHAYSLYGELRDNPESLMKGLLNREYLLADHSYTGREALSALGDRSLETQNCRRQIAYELITQEPRLTSLVANYIAPKVTVDTFPFIRTFCDKQSLTEVTGSMGIAVKVAVQATQKNPVQCETILKHLIKQVPDRTEARLALSAHYIRHSNPNKVVGLWVPVKILERQQALRVIEDLRGRGHYRIANHISRSAEECISHNS